MSGARWAAGVAAVVASGAVSGMLRAQDPPGADSAIALVRSRYAAIQAARLDSIVLAYSSPGGSGSTVRFRETGQLRKVVVTFEGDGASWRLEHYYWSDSLIFAYRRWERFPETGPSRASEHRWYLVQGQVARVLELAEDGRRRTLRPGDAPFTAAASGVLRQAACWRRYAEAGVEGDASC